MIRSLFPIAALLLLTACGEAVKDDHFARDVKQEAAAPPAENVVAAAPVRIGELGANFDACATAGTTRRSDPSGALSVKAAPFETAAGSGTVAPGARFFICTRSHDQRWLGIVYDQAGALAAECGVSAPVTGRRAYSGPCASGWVPSAGVKLIAG